MNIHEYQAKQILRDFGVKTPEGRPAFTVDEAVDAAKELGGDLWVVKAQIHAGGRGKAGGVKLAKSIDEVREHADDILGKTLVTHQTGPDGQKVRRLYIEEGADIDRELYLAAVVDRASGGIVLMGSTEGGVDIEQVAEETPEKIHKIYVDPLVGLADYQCRELAFELGLEGKSVFRAVKFMKGLYKAFVEKDASLAEINPLVVTGDGDIIALDAKMNFDDNGLFRHADIKELRDESEEDEAELEAKQHGLSYVNLDGNIGCMVNGAGLAMATMDIIKHYGGEPANFLDVGGGADTKTVTEAFKIITQDERVQAIFINIFGGIMKCDVIANGVVAAVKEVGLEVPLVVRLAGTNEKEGKAILEESSLNIIPADTMADGAEKAIAAIQ
ncbi:ADP-forming succinate--CoA ligase subunit beta [Persicimonas caeni]|uniref:Succinate--CoA ligase [ADP-forming] subunit beta n=1 Tax=Persicimonas caeni TaxID=2292766 RepID=A0A4Y6Q1M3_PERCE|nr:ADP-forming succinate--CoA ligase subunit beta [Persicimonas caeni]QDG54453.1 ADP-forming succinate--CoA ligase subunit beta [Persicimonas caeni]QED35674.1 ADP-forming succinate--CoA ligase subunit beta [Persicimonas caeni]